MLDHEESHEQMLNANSARQQITTQNELRELSANKLQEDVSQLSSMSIQESDKYEANLAQLKLPSYVNEQSSKMKKVNSAVNYETSNMKDAEANFKKQVTQQSKNVISGFFKEMKKEDKITKKQEKKPVKRNTHEFEKS